MTHIVHRRHALTALLLVALLGCGPGAADDPELRQAENVIRHLTSARHLRMSMYAGTIQTGTPSELVAFLFSTMGAAEWPPADDAPAMDQEQAKAIGAPLVPRQVSFHPAGSGGGAAGKRIVVGADDSRNKIVVRAYAGPGTEAAFSAEWEMPDTSRLRERAR